MIHTKNSYKNWFVTILDHPKNGLNTVRAVQFSFSTREKIGEK